MERAHGRGEFRRIVPTSLQQQEEERMECCTARLAEGAWPEKIWSRNSWTRSAERASCCGISPGPRLCCCGPSKCSRRCCAMPRHREIHPARPLHQGVEPRDVVVVWVAIALVADRAAAAWFGSQSGRSSRGGGIRWRWKESAPSGGRGRR